MNKALGRTPQEWLLNAQVHLLFARRELQNRDQKEWDNLTEAVVELERCLKQVIMGDKWQTK